MAVERRVFRVGQWMIVCVACSAVMSCSDAVNRDTRPYRFTNGLIGGADPLARPRRAPIRPAPRGRQRESVSARRSSSTEPLPMWRAEIVRRAQQLLDRDMGVVEGLAVERFGEHVLGVGRDRIRSACRDSARSNPQPGDVVCFGASPPASSSSCRVSSNASWTNMGVVLMADGRDVEFAYVNGTRVRRGVLNANWPHRRRVGSRIVNTYVRVKHPSDPPNACYLAAELIVGYATLKQEMGSN